MRRGDAGRARGGDFAAATASLEGMDIDHLGDARAACLRDLQRLGRRYAIRLVRHARARDAVADVLELAARRCLPLPVRRRRPLPAPAHHPYAAAFERLAAADRDVLDARLGPHAPETTDARRPGGGPRAEHLASALVRFVEQLERAPDGACDQAS